MAQESPVEQHQVSLQGASRASLTEWAQQYSVEATPLGRGSFASVYRGVNRTTGEPVAIKVMTKARLGEKALQMLAAEINILRTLEHPNVVCLRDSHTTERRILIVLEFCGGGDLGQFIQSRGPSPEPTARHFMLQLAAGLAFLRSRRLIHRDIKPQNLLLSENSPRAILKIADFGLARHLPQGSLAESMLGSPLYMAPEVLSNRAYDAKADLWSAGAVLYELLTAKHPFGGANQNELIRNIRRNRPRLPPGVTLSPECRELLGMLLVPRPSERASLQAFQSCSFLNPDISVASPSPSSGEAPGTQRGGGSGGGEQPAPPAKLPPTDRAFDASTRALQMSSKVVGSISPPWSVETKRERDRYAVDTSAAATAAVVGDEQPRTVIAGTPPGDTHLEGEAERSVGGEFEDGKLRLRGDVDVGVRDDLWGWDWGGQGAGAIGVGLGVGVGVSAGVHEGGGIAEQGPLPALPALPFALGPLGVPRPTEGAGEDESGHHGETGGVFDGITDDGGGGHLATDFALDLAFAAGPLDDPSAREEKVDFEDNERRRDTVVPETVVAPPPFSRSRRRSRSFSGQGAGPSEERGDLANTFSASPDSHTAPTRRGRGSFSNGGGDCAGGGEGGGGDVPEPVFYLGKEGSVPGPNALPAHSRPSVPAPQAPSEHTGSSTPSSSLFPDGGCAGVDTRVKHTSPSGTPHCRDSKKSGARAYLPPVSDGRQLAGPPQQPLPLPLPPAFTDVNQPQQRQKQQQSAGLLGGTGIGGGGSSGGGSVAPPPDGGVPLLTKYPSLRSAGDSLLTIPEDSTGFVLVTRPSSSISCEHGPGCECWASGGGAAAGGGGAGTIRSPSASYLKAANPYGGPGKAAAAVGAQRRSGPGAFLGSVGNIWNTAMNTFRGVAGAHGRRSSLPATRTGRASQQQQQQLQQRRGSSPNISHKLAAAAAAAAVPGGITPTTAVAAGAPGASPLASPREHLSPVSAQIRKKGGCPGSSSGNSSAASISNGGASRGGHGTRGVGVGAGGSSKSANRNALYNQDALTSVDSSSDHGSEAFYADDVAVRRQPPPPPPRSREMDYPIRLIHHRRHSEPIPPRSHPAGTEMTGADAGVGASVGVGGEFSTRRGGGRARFFCKPSEEADYRRTMAAADRAEVVGKRSILIVTLADKTAQEAMSLALESPRDARAAKPRAQQWRAHLRPGVGAGAAGVELGGADRSVGENAHARRRHDMLTESLALYVRALAILQGALPGILAECEGVRIEGLAAWNPSSVDPTHPSQQQRFYRPSQNHSPHQCPPQQKQHQQKQERQKEQEQQQRVGRPSPPSPALMALRSALVSKASWLKELFSQTLLRAEHCREQAGAASCVSASAAQSAVGPPASAPAGATAHLFIKDSGRLTLPSDTASAAVFRSAMEHGQEATVCFMLGRSDAAVAHYVRACALLHLLALEPEMSDVREDALCGRGADLRSQRAHNQQQQQQISSGWQAQLLMMADGYARRVEAITEGDGKKKAEREGAVGVPGGRVEDAEDALPPEFMHTAS